MDKRIILNQIQTPDGTILTSRHVHDYVSYVDKNGLTYMVDGGNDYLRRIIHVDQPYVELSLYEDTSFEEIRKYYSRGGRGKDGNEPLKYVPLCEMGNEWLENCISYNNKITSSDCFPNKMYRKELEYRKTNNIKIDN